jgi:hypothetical protein
MRTRDFLRDLSGSNQFSKLVVGSFVGAPVVLVKDDEFPDRFWLRAAREHQLVDFTLVGSDAADLIVALSQAMEDL